MTGQANSAARPSAVVTGAARGLGRALCDRLAAAGFTVFGWHRTESAELRAQLRATGGDAILADIAEPASVRRAAEYTTALSGGVLDLLVNNAGIGAPPGRSAAAEGPLHCLQADAVDHVLAVNAVGPLSVAQALAPYLAGGTVLNITSDLGSITRAGNDGGYAYAMSKAALNMLTRKLAAELPATTVVALHPGSVRTRLGGAHAELSPEAAARNILSFLDTLDHQASGRFLTTDGTELPW